MAERRQVLGRGLGALIGAEESRPPSGTDILIPDSSTHQKGGSARDLLMPAARPSRRGGNTKGSNVSRETLVPVPGASYAEIDTGAIVANAKQPRTIFDQEDLDELAASIKEVGVLQPIVVRRSGKKYELIMGERRWRAAQLAQLTRIPAIIRKTADEDLLRDALLENLHRAQLNPLEEAAAYQQLLDDFGCTQEQLAARVARSRPQISNTLRLLRLPGLVQNKVAAGVLSAGHARALLALNSRQQMEQLAERIVAEGLSVRSTEEIVTLWGSSEKKSSPRPRTTQIGQEQVQDLAQIIADKLDTRVRAQLGRVKGKIIIEFVDINDLERISSIIVK